MLVGEVNLLSRSQAEGLIRPPLKTDDDMGSPVATRCWSRPGGGPACRRPLGACTVHAGWLSASVNSCHMELSFSLFRGGVPSSFVVRLLLPSWSGLHGPARGIHSPPVSGPFEATVLLAGAVGCLHRPARSAIALRSRFCFTCPLVLSCHACVPLVSRYVACFILSCMF